VRKKWLCPICNYYGPFLNSHTDRGSLVRYADCPSCGCKPRHRLEKLILNQLEQTLDFSKMRLLHFAPEPFFRPYFQNHFKQYTTADLNMNGVDLRADLTNLPIEDGQYDMVIACHVLEHIRDDQKAVLEIRRILSSGGLAIIAVPINSPQTIEYSEPNPTESGHVRAPGPDYYDRLSNSFTRIEVFASGQFPAIHQTRVWADWKGFPTPDSPHRLPLPGNNHSNRIAVCYA
jgi:SAM-dependent methyltransferase